MDVSELQFKLRQFAAERDWEQFHSPKNLAISKPFATAIMRVAMEPLRHNVESQMQWSRCYKERVARMTAEHRTSFTPSTGPCPIPDRAGIRPPVQIP